MNQNTSFLLSLFLNLNYLFSKTFLNSYCSQKFKCRNYVIEHFVPLFGKDKIFQNFAVKVSILNQILAGNRERRWEKKNAILRQQLFMIQDANHLFKNVKTVLF